MKLNSMVNTGKWVFAAAFVAASVNATPTHATDKNQAGTTIAPKEGAIILWSDRPKMAGYAKEKELLQNLLETATSQDELRQLVLRQGYVITAINELSTNELEYEVVKGDRSYEVSAGISSTGRLEGIEVGNNVYPALTTRKALADSAYKVDTVIYDKSTGQLYRDSRYEDQRETDRKLLAPPDNVTLTVEQYKQGMSKLGFRFTSTNAMEDDYVEFEVVRNQQTYELQLDLNEQTKTINKVEVTPNFWRAEATERALVNAQ